MGNLITETPYSEVTATLEAMANLGIGREDLTALRKYEMLRGHVFEPLIRAVLLRQDALGEIELIALEATQTLLEPILFDEELLTDIARKAKFTSVRKLAAQNVRNDLLLSAIALEPDTDLEVVRAAVTNMELEVAVRHFFTSTTRAEARRIALERYVRLGYSIEGLG